MAMPPRNVQNQAKPRASDMTAGSVRVPSEVNPLIATLRQIAAKIAEVIMVARKESFIGADQAKPDSLFCSTLPLGDRAEDHAKQRVGIGGGDSKLFTINRRTALPQLSAEPGPFVLQLAVRDGDGRHPSIRSELRPIEPVAARLCLGVNDGEVAVDRRAGRLGRAETPQLRMGAIALGPAAQHLAGEQRLAPKRDKPRCIEVLRMEAP